VVGILVIEWRKRVGIEPTGDVISAPHAALKAGRHTSYRSASVDYLFRLFC
jgi:hypothetical protein